MKFFRIIYIFLFILLGAGLYLRFANLSLKVYSQNETNSSLRISGYTVKEFRHQIYRRGQILTGEDLKKFQRPAPEKSAWDTIKSQARENPQHPPFYYVIARFWEQCFGSSILKNRIFSVLLSLLALPAIYWLSRELFKSSVVNWTAVTLLAISPMNVIYSRVVRQYGLWTVLLLVLSASFLYALRKKSIFSWFIYAISLGISLYTHLFSIFVAFAHGIYLVLVGGFKNSKILRAYLIASAFGLMMFLPWGLILLNAFDQVSHTTDWTRQQIPSLGWIQAWGLNICRNFVDCDPNGLIISFGNTSIAALVRWGLVAISVFLVPYSFYFLYSNCSKNIWHFILILTGSSALFLILPDLIFGGIRSIIPRYLIPFFLGVHLSIAYLISSFLSKIHNDGWKRILKGSCIFFVVFGNIISCTANVQSEYWWDNGQAAQYPQIARIINGSDHPLVMSDTFRGRILSLAHLSNPKVKFLLGARIPNSMPKGFTDVFLFRPSMKLKNKIKGKWGCQFRSVYKNHNNQRVWLSSISKMNS